jgi:D-lactate dehydrogenase
MKIAVYEAEQWERDACLRFGPEHDVACTDEPLNERTAGEHADAVIVSPFIGSRLGAEVLARFPRLKLVATRSTGYDHIDLSYCDAHGITVCNVPDYGDATVAEHVFALLLAVTRHIPEAAERMRRGDFSQSGLRGFELRSKVLGVIGAGRIGRRVIEIAKGFGMEAIAFDARPDDAAARRLGFRYVQFDEALAAADVLTVHLPATAATVHLLSDREFGLMKPGAVLINTARGTTVDVAALVRTLSDGKLRAVGLDVLPQEPVIREEAEIFRSEGRSAYDLKGLVANHVILQFPNVVVTPHIAYNTDEAVHRIIATTLENIEAFVRGEPRNAVATARQTSGSAPRFAPVRDKS